MSKIIKNRIDKLRGLMREKGLQAYLLNGSDPHMSEYVPDRWKTRDYLSGFTGSYGFMAITQEKALLWTDSRYYIQAKQELEDTGIEMMKARDPGAVMPGQWLAGELKEGSNVGLDGTCYSASEVNQFKSAFSSKKIKLDTNFDLINELWDNRPALPNSTAYLHLVKWAGLTRVEKFIQINSELEKHNSDYIIITALDDLAWAFNIRGSDVECNPVVLGFGIIGKGVAQLFIDEDKLTNESKNELAVDGVRLFPYCSFYSSLNGIKGNSVLLDTTRSNHKVYECLQSNNKIIEKISIPAILKSVKNHSEILGMKKAQISDGLALLDFFLWLENELPKRKLSEYDVAMKLDEMRSKRTGYIGTSFFPIVAYKEHGAIVHYSVSRQSASTLKPEGILLIDSGGQYEYGTTDITRTFALGPVTEQVQKDFTLVLKGMIALSMAKFPKGTAGCHLDILARKALWDNNLNYGHGTGHGVGAFLNVHEGPQSIRPDFNTQPILPGNIFSNEPGVYREGDYGIRTENLMICVERCSNDFGTFLEFETLTRFPIDTQLIEPSLLTTTEIQWINNYHTTVLEELSSFANSKELNLLHQMTQAI